MNLNRTEVCVFHPDRTGVAAFCLNCLSAEHFEKARRLTFKTSHGNFVLSLVQCQNCDSALAVPVDLGDFPFIECQFEDESRPLGFYFCEQCNGHLAELLEFYSEFPTELQFDGNVADVLSRLFLKDHENFVCCNFEHCHDFPAYLGCLECGHLFKVSDVDEDSIDEEDLDDGIVWPCPCGERIWYTYYGDSQRNSRFLCQQCVENFGDDWRQHIAPRIPRSQRGRGHVSGMRQ